MKIKESDGTHKGETVFCPVNGWNCPYWTNGVCGLDNPIAECDDFAAMYGEDADPSEYTCYGDSGCDVWDMGN